MLIVGPLFKKEFTLHQSHNAYSHGRSQAINCVPGTLIVACPNCSTEWDGTMLKFPYSGDGCDTNGRWLRGMGLIEVAQL